MELVSKKCTSCGEVKPKELFYRHKKSNDGFSWYCKKCVDVRNKNNFTNNKEKYYIAIRASARKRAPKRKENFKIKYRYFKDKLIAGYGGKCCKCGFSDKRALQIDHVNGGGCKDKDRSSLKLWRKLIRENFPSNFQLLCANCNTIKMYENKEFPGWKSMEVEVPDGIFEKKSA